jgi:hypothetical protein
MSGYNAPQREDKLSLSIYNPSNFRNVNSDLVNYANLYLKNKFFGSNYFYRPTFFLSVVDFSSGSIIFQNNSNINIFLPFISTANISHQRTSL